MVVIREGASRVAGYGPPEGDHPTSIRPAPYPLEAPRPSPALQGEQDAVRVALVRMKPGRMWKCDARWAGESGFSMARVARWGFDGSQAERIAGRETVGDLDVSER